MIGVTLLVKKGFSLRGGSEEEKVIEAEPIGPVGRIGPI
jgi:hypothetical protein